MNRICPLTLAIWLFLGSGAAAAQEPPTATEAGNAPTDEETPLSRLDEVLVTATRSEHPGFRLPYYTHSISAEEAVGRRLSRTATDALAETTGVMAQKTAYGQGSPFLRGLTGFRTLLLIDGVRLNNSTFRDGPNQYWNTVDPYSLDRIEVVKGPSSVLYGSDAIGGTIQAISRSHPEYTEEGWAYSSRSIYRYASAERSHVGRLEAGGSYAGEFGLDVGVTWREYGDYTAGRHQGTTSETGYDEIDGDLRLEMYLRPDLKVVTLFQHAEQDDVPRTHKTVHGQSWRGTTVGTDRIRVLNQQRALGYVQLHWEETGLPVETIRASLSYQRQDEEQFRIRGSGVRERQGVTVNTFGFWAQGEIPSAIGRFTFGADYYHDEVSSFFKGYDATGVQTSTGIQGPVGDDARYDLLGVYLQDEATISDDLVVIPGVRYTHAAAHAEEVEDPLNPGQEISVSDEWDHVGGSLRAIYSVTKDWNIYGGASQGWRAPNLSDLTRLDTARTNEIETPSPGLEPEQYLTLEIGSKERSGFISAQIAYYYTFIQDMIVRFPTGNVIAGDNEVQKDNVGDGYIQGVEFEAEAHFDEAWSLFGGFAWTEGRVDTFPTATGGKSRRPADRIPPPMGQIGLRWRNPDGGAWAEGYVRIVGEQDQLSPGNKVDTERIPSGGTPGYTIFGIRGGLRIHPRLGVTLAIENLTNRDYRVHGSGQNEAGTNVILGIELQL
ncbi:MAG: TonB-dependent receptor [Planctomycetota bacterium]|nr:TonB-dependent receptor [Planctomycetota bacterium]